MPQSWQPHVLLYRGPLSLEQLLPGIRADLIARGAVPIDTGNLAWLGEQGWMATGKPFFEIVSMTRQLLDDVVRRRVAALPGVSALHARVRGFGPPVPRPPSPRWPVRAGPHDLLNVTVHGSLVPLGWAA